MKRNWQPEELVECWTLLPSELALLAHKNPQNRLIFALLLKFFELEARFPESEHEIPSVVVNYITQQLKISPSIYHECNWQGRSIIYYRKKIREFFGFREASKKDALQLTDWLTEQALIYELKYEQLKSAAISRLRELKIEPPTQSRLERIVRSALSSFESNFFQRTVAQLSNKTKEQIDNLFKPQKIEEQSLEVVSQLDIDEEALSVWNELKLDPGRIGVGSFQKEIEKLLILRQLDLPPDLFTNISAKILQQYKQRVVVEYPKDLRRHPEPIRYTLVAIFALLRSQEIVDNLVELIIQIVHRIGTKAEKRIDQELLKDFKKVNGKTNLLFQMAEASLQQPDGVIKDVIFPVVSETTLKNLVKEYKSTGNVYRERVYTVMRSSYGRHYRRILPLILQQLEFRSNNEVHRPVIQALLLLKKYALSNQRYYDSTENVPIEGVLRSGWQELILEKNSDGDIKVNRINYELSVLQALREKLRCKEIWVVGAYRYRNPEEDLPKDFESQRTEYFQALKLPDDVEEFITDLQQKMQSALSQLESGLPKNKYVKIKNQGKSKICVSPLKPQSEPINLCRLKTEINRRWPKTSLLDVLKETDLRVNFTEHFQSVLTREVLDSKLLQKRLLLCLYGLGTNTGLKRLSDEIGGSSYQELLHVKRAYIHKQQLCNAITNIANAIFGTRLKHIWGEGTAACATEF